MPAARLQWGPSVPSVQEFDQHPQFDSLHVKLGHPTILATVLALRYQHCAQEKGSMVQACDLTRDLYRYLYLIASLCHPHGPDHQATFCPRLGRRPAGTIGPTHSNAIPFVFDILVKGLLAMQEQQAS